MERFVIGKMERQIPMERLTDERPNMLFVPSLSGAITGYLKIEGSRQIVSDPFVVAYQNSHPARSPNLSRDTSTIVSPVLYNDIKIYYEQCRCILLLTLLRVSTTSRAFPQPSWVPDEAKAL